MGSEMKFLALVTDFEENQEVIHAVIVNPRSRRGRVIKFSRSELQTEEEWQRPFVAKASVLIGDLENGGRVSDVKVPSRQQFRGFIKEWDPVEMEATVEYPEIQETHSHRFDTPWLAKGDRIVVEGDLDGLEWSVEDFGLHRRVQTWKLEQGIITELDSANGRLRSMFNENLEFDTDDVLLCDCRDFFPRSLPRLRYFPELGDTFKVGEQVFFIRTQNENLERSTINVFVPKTEFGRLDTIFEPIFSDFRVSPSEKEEPLKPRSRGCCNQTVYEDASFPQGLKHQSRPNLRYSPIMTSCPDINAYCDR